LTLTGTGNINATGNALANVITGNAGNNILNGGAGADTMIGGMGNDTYVVDNAGDVVTEGAGAGTDTVDVSIATAGGNYTLGSDVENGTLINTVAFSLTGNSLNNVLTSNAAIDTLAGGMGNDTYVVNNLGDVIVENPGEGTDTVNVNIATAGGTYTLGANIENGTLTNSVAYNLVGNSSSNIITGNGAANILTGGGGADTFVFNNAPSATNIDTITDFTSGTDILQLNHAVFAAAGLGTVNASDFVSSTTAAGATAHDATDHFIYNSSTGALYYDADGSGAGAKVQIATLGTTAHPALAAADIHVA
jgi:Ca2+-binding RTX toxin-like protein